MPSAKAAEKPSSKEAKVKAAESKWLSSLTRDQKIAMAAEKYDQENPPASPEVPMANQAETGIRSALSSATLGLSEPLISGANALVGQGIEAAMGDQGLAALSPEQIAQAYQADVTRREQLQQQAPIASTVGSIAGAFSPVGPAAAVFRGAQGVAGGLGAISKLPQFAQPIARGALGAGAGIGATVGAEQGIERLTGFTPEGPGAIEQAQTGAGVGGALSAVPVVGRGLQTGAKAAFSSTFGVRPSAVSRYLERANEMATQGITSKSDLTEKAHALVDELKGTAQAAQLDLVDEIQNGLGTLKQQVSNESALSREILGQSAAKFPLSQIKAAIQQAGKSVERPGVVGASAQSAKEKVANFVNSLEGLPEEIDGSTLKNIIQSLDRDTEFLQIPGTFSKNLGQQALSQARSNLDDIIKTQVPAYAEQMKKVSGLAGLLEESSKLFGGEQKSFGALSKLGKPGKPIQDQKLSEFFKGANVDPERFRLAQENAEVFKNWGSLNTVEKKIQSLMHEKSIEVKNQFTQLSSLSDTDFVRTIENLSLQNQFEQEFLRGSRNPVLWAIIGSVTGGGLGGGTIGAAMGAATGALIDKYGPKMAKKILEQVAAIEGIPTVQKIKNLNLSPEARDYLSQSFVRTYLEGKKENAPISIPPASRAIVMKEIQQSKNLNALERARAMSELNEHGEVSLLPKIMGGGEKPEVSYEEPVSVKPNGPAVKDISNFVKARRAEKY